ncbi:UDP-N-acetylmuramoyl-L-alanine--D-glutamate ligase [uncultured Treponema sp.]|uniref:UDP-N-acetylmuramoyl-L-alanine--D-glutamate ligase n=1 Tax=uncultured Treponema sp. TaxID=162155 RepID=UPI0025F05EDC|nr:UDP-N-acetylmuramoyl-L-alanine--D-glutamate ligase [uncultured Treponema sp.]
MSDETEPKPPAIHFYPKGCFFKSIEDIKDKHVTVMGLGLNGGGEATVRFLLNHGAYVIATDMKTEADLQSTVDSLNNDESLDKSRLVYRLGTHNIEDFENADCVIKNPGVKYDGNKYLAAAKAIETDISLFLAFSKAPIIAVTGSKGKSSTVSAIYYGLKQSGFSAFLGGNITVSPLTFLDQTDETTPVVLELSSWQLADLRGRRLLKPKVSIITKIIPDHQNFYHSMLAYVNDKKLIYADQTKKDFAIFDFDTDAAADGGTLIDNWGNIFAKECKATILRYSKKQLPDGILGVWQDKKGVGKARLSTEILNTLPQDYEKTTETVLKDLIVPGKHMRANVLNAALVLRIMGVSPERIIEVLGRWNGIEHRLEFFHECKIGNTTYRFYNDSAATVPEASAEATQAFGQPVIFLTGGTDKGLDLSPIANAICENGKNIVPKAVYLLAGTASDKMIPDFNAKKVAWKGTFNSLEEMLSQLKADLENGIIQPAQNDAKMPQVVVFSPGSTSFGMFKNEFDRGNQFKAFVKKIFSTSKNM